MGGGGSYSDNVRSGGGSAGKQQPQRPGGGTGGSSSGKGGSKGGSKGGGKQASFNVAALPSKPLMNAATTKDVQGPKAGGMRAGRGK